MSVLLRQARAFERLGGVEIVAHPKHLAVPVLGHEADRRIEFSTAGPATASNTPERDNPPVQVAIFRNLDVAQIETLVDISEVFEDTLMPLTYGRLPAEHHLENRVPLHIWVKLRQQGFVVLAIARLYGAFEGFDVLLRHRPRCIPQAQESACASCSDSATASRASELPG
jgi:hypothetical protein